MWTFLTAFDPTPELFSIFIVFNQQLLCLFTIADNEEWGGMCAAGKRQSPVDLAHEAAIKGEFPGFIFQNYDEPMKNPEIINNGHSSKFYKSI